VPDDDGSPPAERTTEQAEALVLRAATLARWAARTSSGLARQLPGAAAVESELGRLERTVLGELRRRLDDVDPLPAAAAETLPAPVAPPDRQTEPLRAAMAELLLRSMEQTPQRGREYHHLALLRQLLPDEARILAALADGSRYPLVHVDCRTGVSGSRRLLANASTVGRAAGVAVPEAVPRYVTRLLQLGLVEVGDADADLGVQYDILLTDSRVRAAEEDARRVGRVRIARHTLGVAPLGRELWEACRPVEATTWVDVTEEAVQPAEPPALDGPAGPPGPAS
jgi:hypothetical protein